MVHRSSLGSTLTEDRKTVGFCKGNIISVLLVNKTYFFVKKIPACIIIYFIMGLRVYFIMNQKQWLDVNSLWPSDDIWWHRSLYTMAQVMACCPTAPGHCLNQCWLIISEVKSPPALTWGQFQREILKIFLKKHVLELPILSSQSPRGQWVKQWYVIMILYTIIYHLAINMGPICVSTFRILLLKILVLVILDVNLIWPFSVPLWLTMWGGSLVMWGLGMLSVYPFTNMV